MELKPEMRAMHTLFRENDPRPITEEATREAFDAIFTDAIETFSQLPLAHKIEESGETTAGYEATDYNWRTYTKWAPLKVPGREGYRVRMVHSVFGNLDPNTGQPAAGDKPDEVLLLEVLAPGEGEEPTQLFVLEKLPYGIDDHYYEEEGIIGDEPLPNRFFQGDAEAIESGMAEYRAIFAALRDDADRDRFITSE